ncbi:MAG TPA: DUF6531 domain-containing protein, partial [Acidimicrobiales bacterium]|nr:DUF6531 domain-containing protein [Acidimicrobiales bacterium]
MVPMAIGAPAATPVEHLVPPPRMPFPGSAGAPPAQAPVPPPTPPPTAAPAPLAPQTAVVAAAAPADAAPASADPAPAPAESAPPPAVPPPNPADITKGDTLDPATAELVGHTEKADIFRDPSGATVARIWSKPQNFLDAAGTWKKIDNTIVPTGDGFKNAAGKVDFSFAGATGDARDVVQVSDDGWSVGLSLVGAAKGKAGKPDKHVITYKDVLPGADLEYHVDDESVKEFVTLKQAPGPKAPTSFRFQLKLKGVTTRVEANGAIGFHDADGQLVGLIPQGAALDSAKTPATNPVRVELVEGGAAVDVSVDGAWLRDPGRVYPVQVDPALVAGRTTTHDDMYVTSGQPDTTFNSYLQNPDGTGPKLRDGYTDVVGTTWTEWDSYARYDFSVANDTFIERAYWNGYFFSGNATRPLAMWRLAQSFNSSISGGGTTYNTRPQHYIGPTDRVNPTGSSGWINPSPPNPYQGVDITQWVYDWTRTSGGMTNNGIVFDTAGDTAVYDVFGSEGLDQVSPRQDPYVDVYYNHVPNVPTQAAPANGSVGASVRPLLQATFSDPDGDSGSCYFAIYNSSNVLVSTVQSATVASGATCQARPPNSLANLSSYTWKVRGNDGYRDSAFSGLWGFTTGVVATITKTGPSGTVSRGQAVQYTVTVSNPDAGALAVTSVTDTLPAGLSAASVRVGATQCTSASAPTCSVAGNVITVGGFSLGASGTPSGTKTFVISTVAKGSDESNCSTVAQNLATVTTAAGATAANAPSFLVCDAQLGFEPWWSYAQGETGPQGASSVNVANGNLVVSQTDSTPIQGHGHLGLVLRRTYNSQDTRTLSFPGSWGGWTMNFGEVDALAGGGISAAGLSVPASASALLDLPVSPLAVTLVDRDGTHHVFEPSAAGILAMKNNHGMITKPTGAMAVVVPRTRVPVDGETICVDQMYKAPKGVHVGLWRYISTTASGACTFGAGSSDSIVGYVMIRPDRLRVEFSASGEILSMVDGNGVELRYLYERSVPGASLNLGRLLAVYEVSSVCPWPQANPIAAACRGFRLTYPTSTETQVKDPAGRVTRYLFSGTTPNRLTQVVNPPDAAGATSTLTYQYGTCGIANSAANPNQLCSVGEPRGHPAKFAYQAGGPAGSPPYVSAAFDRQGTGENFVYGQGVTTAS